MGHTVAQSRITHHTGVTNLTRVTFQGPHSRVCRVNVHSHRVFVEGVQEGVGAESFETRPTCPVCVPCVSRLPRCLFTGTGYMSRLSC